MCEHPSGHRIELPGERGNLYPTQESHGDGMNSGVGAVSTDDIDSALLPRSVRINGDSFTIVSLYVSVLNLSTLT